MTDNVVDIQRYRDDAAFLFCPKCETDSFHVVARGTNKQPFIAAVVCAACDGEILIVNGYLE